MTCTLDSTCLMLGRKTQAQSMLGGSITTISWVSKQTQSVLGDSMTAISWVSEQTQFSLPIVLEFVNRLNLYLLVQHVQ